MKTKSIKKVAITAAVIVAVCAVFALLYFGLSQLLHVDKGQVVAEYDGNLVYESDVQDIINYQLITQVTDSTTNEELIAIMQSSIKTYVKYKVMELDLEEKGYTINEDDLKQTVEESKAQLEESFGYKEWCEMYRVSEDFLEEDIRRYFLADLYYEYAKTNVQVSESEAKAYYTANALTDYIDPAGYTWTSLLVPVRDFTDAEEMAAAKVEADAYLAKLQNGTMTFDEVKTELAGKYNETTAYVNAQFSGEDFTSLDDMVIFEDEAALNDLIDQLDEVYANRDVNAETNSEAYNNYMNFKSNVFKANVYYALQRLEVGEIWDSTIESFVGYFIIRLDDFTTKNGFVPFDDVKDDIINTLLSEKLESGLSEYFNSIESEYNVVYYIA